MNELLWIKSLLNFLIVCLSGLIIGVLYNHRKKAIVWMWAPVTIGILIMQLWSFLWSLLRFTGWFSSFEVIIDSLHPLYILLNFLLGPIVLNSFQNTRFQNGFWLHALPALGSLVLLWIAPEIIELLKISSMTHFIGYALYLLVRLDSDMSYIQGKKAVKTIMWLLVISNFLHVAELVLWAQLNIISEIFAWVLFISSEIILGFSLLYLVYALASSESTFDIKEQPRLPKEILHRLEQNFTNYITNPSVYTDPLISQQKVAKDLKVSSYHISRYLNHYYGDSFLNVINSQRIKASQELIKDPNNQEMTIQDIFYRVGFNSKSTFNTAFKNLTGFTPSEYRDQALTKSSVE
ncbi:helix-turn-helix transcriptional regulator [Ekhidna sp. MALMAid0563]|uniref:helix-turn-helix domain-containing protein n=1 Tax=Ekhidna sp. MALMAid0563 TaxID=3143937 RepID=UPI0032DFA04A